MAPTTSLAFTPWYRQGWPWFLISLPLIAVVASFITLYLAIISDDSMVVDDYYKEGKAINQRIHRDVEAAALGLSASLVPIGTTAVELDLLAQAQPFVAPDTLTVRWVHVTEAALDQTARFDRVRDGLYRGPVAWPAYGRWRVHVEEPTGRWRLVSPAWKADGVQSLEIKPRAGLTTREHDAADKEDKP